MSLEKFKTLDIEPLIAPGPVEPRDASRLLRLDRASGALTHASFRDLPSFLRPGDCLVLNRSAVRKARLPARKLTGGKAELLLVAPVDESLKLWKALGRKLPPGTALNLPDGSGAETPALRAAYLALDDRQSPVVVEHPEVAQTAREFLAGLGADLREVGAVQREVGRGMVLELIGERLRPSGQGKQGEHGQTGQGFHILS